LKDFIDQHRQVYGDKPIFKVLQSAPSCYRRHASRQHDPALCCAKTQRDTVLVPQIQNVWQTNTQVYSTDKVWHQMNREGVAVARCTVERLCAALAFLVYAMAKLCEPP
jgi:hypothetical protein